MSKLDKAVERRLERMKIDWLAEQKFVVWLEEQKNPPAPVKPPQPVLSPAHAAALGVLQMPPMSFGDAARREQVLEHRRDMRALRDDPGICPPWGTGTKIQDYENEERNRYAVASEMLKRGVADGHVAAACDLEESEIPGIRKQLGL